ncbi:AAA family ATPase [Acidobacteriota bacterium]
MNSDDLKSVIAEWLEEWTFPPLVPREIPLPNLHKLSVILAIVGPRRSGKTFLMYQMIQTLLAAQNISREDILFIDFEDYRLTDFRPRDMEGLLSTFNQLTGRLPRFVFLDEVQHMPQWSRLRASPDPFPLPTGSNRRELAFASRPP